jgi:quercetin dioxygenase-like cupin family protein
VNTRGHHRSSFSVDALETPPAFHGRSSGFRRQSLLDGSHGSVHSSYGVCELAPGGTVAAHVHSFEESFYVLQGAPALELAGQAVELGPDQCGILPVGTTHAWRNDGPEPACWLEMQAPRARMAGERRPPDTFFVDEQLGGQATPVDVRDPRNRRFFRLDAGQMDVDVLKRGSSVNEPTVSASMATALLAYSGIAVKMLIDERLGAGLHTMFMVEYQPGGVAHPHDHPLEETYYVLDGEVVAEADGERFTLRPGDFLWTGVGSVHAFYNETETTVRWLETSSPQPPARNSYRFNRDWDYLVALPGGEAAPL